jgi:hypothetical protein
MIEQIYWIYKDKILGKRKRLLREKRQALHQKAAMMRLKYETEQAIKQSMNNVMETLLDEMNRQESYRWN